MASARTITRFDCTYQLGHDCDANITKILITVYWSFTNSYHTLNSWMFFTTSGSSSTLNILSGKLNNLEYEYKSGTLATGLYLEKVKWQLENKTVISAPSVKFNWNPKCWNAKEVCISQMAVDQLVVDIADSNEEADVISLSLIHI